MQLLYLYFFTYLWVADLKQHTEISLTTTDILIGTLSSQFISLILRDS